MSDELKKGMDCFKAVYQDSSGQTGNNQKPQRITDFRVENITWDLPHIKQEAGVLKLARDIQFR
jgi:hypothetical protein